MRSLQTSGKREGLKFIMPFM